MVLQISPEIQARIAEMAQRGSYPDVDTMLEQALTLLEAQEQHAYLKELLAVAADQVANGDVIPYHDDFRTDARRGALERFEAGERAGPDVRP